MKRENKAVIGIPTYLLVIIIVTAVITGMLAIGITSLQRNLCRQQVINQINTIVNKAEVISAASYDETVLTFKVTFPKDMKKAVFGALPINKSENITFHQNILTEKSLCVLFDDNHRFIKHSPVRFCDRSGKSYATLSSGSYHLVLEVTQMNGESYVKIYQQ